MSSDQIKNSGVRADSRVRTANLSLYGSFQKGENKITIPDAGADAALLLSEGATAMNGALTLGSSLTFGAGGSIVADTEAIAAGATATSNKMAGVLESAALTTAALGVETITLTNSLIAVGDLVMISAAGGTTTKDTIYLSCVAGAGSAVISITNTSATVALDGTVIVNFLVVKA